jgi:putative membrane protein
MRGKVLARMTTPLPKEETLRIHQANERTMLAWVRTGIALMAFGFAIERFALFMHQIAALAPRAKAAPSLGSSWVGASLVALGMLANLLATIRYARVRRAIERGEVGAPSAGLVYALGVVATLIGLAMTIMLARALGQE